MKEARGKNLNFKLPVVVIDFGINLNFLCEERRKVLIFNFHFGLSQAIFCEQIYTHKKKQRQKEAKAK